jgi:GNAT superfamily N-acetyltransferase
VTGQSASDLTVRELLVGDTHLAQPALLELRPGYSSEGEFVNYVDGVLRPDGYRLCAAFSAARTAAAVVGFRVITNLALGQHLYVDDLSTIAEARRNGHAQALMGWLIEEGRRLGCAKIHLDSMVGPTRFAAHRFYHASGLSIYAHHFAREL